MDKSLQRRAADALVWKFIDNAGVQAIFLVRLLVMARLLSPEDFGLLAIGVTAVAIFMTLSNFGIGPALIQRADVNERDFQTGWTMGIARAALVCAAVLVSAPWLAELFGDTRATPLMQVLALGVMIDAGASAKVASLSRELKFRSLAILHLANAVTSTCIAVALAGSYGVWAMVIGSLAGSLVTAGLSYVLAPFRPHLAWHKPSASELFNFGRWIFLTGVIAMVASSALRAIIARKLGVAELGIFYLSVRLAYLPAQAVIGVVEPVAFPLYARLQASREHVAKLYRSALLAIAAILVPGCFLLVVITPGLVTHVLGDSWAETTFAIQILAIAAALGLLGDASTPLLRGLGQPSKETRLELIQSATSLVLVFFLTTTHGLPGAVVALLIASAVSQPLCARYVRQLLDDPFRGLLKPLSVIGTAALLGSGLAALLDFYTFGIVGFVTATLVGSVTAYGLVVALDNRLNLGLMTLLNERFPFLARLTSSP